MTDFVPSFSTQQLLPPWYSKGSKNWAFIVETKRECIQNYLDTWLNSPGPDYSPYYWQALPAPEHGHGVLLVCDHADFSSMQEVDGILTPGFESLAHRELIWFFPAYRYQRSPDNLLIGRPEITWIQPFAFDNSSFVMFSSREIWGCEKDIARIQVYADKEHPETLHIDTSIQGCKQFTPKSLSHQIGVMRIKLTSSGSVFDWDRIAQDSDMGELLGCFLGGIAGPTTNPVTGEGTHNIIKINTLKQFRDAFDMRFAAYRAIIESQVTQTEVSDFKFYRGEDVKLDFMWSDSCAEAWKRLFGLEQPAQLLVPPGDAPAPAHGIDWDMPIVAGKVALAVSFTSNSTFEVLDTLFTYGLPTGE
jgi:hypothetical protein